MASYWPPPASGRGPRWWRRCGAHADEGSERNGMEWNGMEWMCSRRRRLPCDLWVPMLMPWMQSEQAMMPVATQRAVILIKGREHASSALMRISLIGSWSFEFFLCFVEENSSSIPSKKFPPLLFYVPWLIISVADYFHKPAGVWSHGVCNLLDLLCGFDEKQKNKRCDVMAAARVEEWGMGANEMSSI